MSDHTEDTTLDHDSDPSNLTEDAIHRNWYLKERKSPVFLFVDDERDTLEPEIGILSGHGVETIVCDTFAHLLDEIDLLTESPSKRAVGLGVDLNLPEAKDLEEVGRPDIDTLGGKLAGLRFVQDYLTEEISRGRIPALPVAILSANPMKDVIQALPVLRNKIEVFACKKLVSQFKVEDIGSEISDELDSFDKIVERIERNLDYPKVTFSFLQAQSVQLPDCLAMHNALAEYFNLDEEESLRVLGFHQTGLSIQELTGGVISGRDWFDRLKLIFELRASAHGIFGDQNQVRKWLRTKDGALSGASPIEVLRDGSTLDIKRLAGFVKYGL